MGLAHALEAARRGLSVVVFERNAHALGASIRNFGMVLPLGMAPGIMHARAMRSVEVWREVIAAAGMWHAPHGALVVACREDEAAVLREFAATAPDEGYEVAWVPPAEALRRSPALHDEALCGALWSPVELVVDPREALQKLSIFLRDRYGVRFAFGTAVTGIALPYIEAGGKT